MALRSFLVDNGQLDLDAGIEITPPMIAVDQTGTRWYKPAFDTPWTRLRPGDVMTSTKTVNAELKLGFYDAAP